MSTIRLSGTTSGHYDLTVPAVAGTNSIDLSNLAVKDTNGNITGVGGPTPSFMATASASTTNNASNTAAKFPFNTVQFNIGGGTYDTTNHRWTPGIAGWYMIHGNVVMKDYQDNNNYEQQNVAIRRNGSEVNFVRRHLTGLHAAGSYNTISINIPIQLGTTDYVEVWSSCYNTNFDMIHFGSWFSGFRVN